MVCHTSFSSSYKWLGIFVTASDVFISEEKSISAKLLSRTLSAKNQHPKNRL
jgi:hypothetical protein